MRMMLIGRTGCGKTTLAQRINGLDINYKKTQMILFVQSALDEETFFPPKFSTMFTGKIIIGIITKKDLQLDCSNAESFLRCAGAEEIYYMGLDDEIEIVRLKERLGIGDESKNSNS